MPRADHTEEAQLGELRRGTSLCACLPFHHHAGIPKHEHLTPERSQDRGGNYWKHIPSL